MSGGGDTNHEEEMEILEDWLEMDTGDEYCMESTNEVQVNFTDLYDELEFLEKKIVEQKMHIQHVK
jgi:uncharacterized circularly permuted ATP-grasp superfamily protein